MTDLFTQALSPQVMNAAWKHLRTEKTVWRPGLNRWDMENDLVLHILALVEELRTGRYRPAPLRQFTITKGDGKQRVLSALSLRDKLAQRAVLTVLEPIGEQLFCNDSYGYRAGRSIEMAFYRAKERIVCGLPWLVDADIRSFFDTIPHSGLRKVLKRHIPDQRILNVIDLWLAEGGSHFGFLRGRRGIAQGFVISPFLCNLYLHQLDTALIGKNIPFVRFADDFLLFAPDKASAEMALAFVKKELAALKLELNSEKTRVVKSGPGVQFLGFKMPKAKV